MAGSFVFIGVIFTLMLLMALAIINVAYGTCDYFYNIWSGQQTERIYNCRSCHGFIVCNKYCAIDIFDICSDCIKRKERNERI